MQHIWSSLGIFDDQLLLRVDSDGVVTARRPKPEILHFDFKLLACHVIFLTYQYWFCTHFYVVMVTNGDEIVSGRIELLDFEVDQGCGGLGCH